MATGAQKGRPAGRVAHATQAPVQSKGALIRRYSLDILYYVSRVVVARSSHEIPTVLQFAWRSTTG